MRNGIHVKVPRWLGEIVKYHMERLRLLNLDASPPGVAMGEVTRIWAETIAASGVYDEALDAPRFHSAFMTLQRTVERWPAPRHLLEALPARAEALKLPPPPVTEADRERARVMLAGITRKLRMSQHESSSPGKLRTPEARG